MGDNTTYKHWYDMSPSRLEMDKIAMSLHFPDFELHKEHDGSLYWIGIFKDTETIQKLPYGFFTSSIIVPPGCGGALPPSREYFSYFLWDNWTGYIKCDVCFSTSNRSELIPSSDIAISEKTDVVYNYYYDAKL